MTQEVKEAGAAEQERVDESYPTIQDILSIYRNHGFDIIQSAEGGTENRDWHLIQFKGDFPDEGFRGMAIALKHGRALARLRAIPLPT